MTSKLVGCWRLSDVEMAKGHHFVSFVKTEVSTIGSSAVQVARALAPSISANGQESIFRQRKRKNNKCAIANP